MEGVGWIATIVIGILAGWIAERVTSRSHGLLMNLIVGLFGAVIGRFIAQGMGIAYTGWWASLLVSTLGAILLLVIIGAIRGRQSA